MRALRAGVSAVLVPAAVRADRLCARSAHRHAQAHRDRRLSRHGPPGLGQAERSPHQLSHYHQGALVSRRAARECRYRNTSSRPSTGSGRECRVHLLLEMRPNGQNSFAIAHPGDKSPATPALRKMERRPSRARLRYEDFLEQQDFWPGQTSEGKAKFGARDCEVVKSTPGPPTEPTTPQVKTWLDPSIEFPVYVEKTVKETGEVKEFTYYGIRHEEGVWSAHQLEVKTRGQSGSTLLIIDRGSTEGKSHARRFQTPRN